QNGQAPLITELCQELKLKSLRSVTQRLEALEAKGFIKRDRFKHRGISLLENLNPFEISGMMRVPVIASAGCDAMEVYAQEKYDEYLSVDQAMIGHHHDIVAVKAIGNSMIDAGINNGDYVLVEVTDSVSDGDRVVAIIGDMAVIKRFHRTSNAVILEPESKNGGYSPFIMKEDFKVFGKVISVIQNPHKDMDDFEVVYEKGYK
ncbi:MAG: repressor LexA, partial [Candidatus Taylorbacteria bacterium RIFOXYD2_FULL_36_9]